MIRTHFRETVSLGKMAFMRFRVWIFLALVILLASTCAAAGGDDIVAGPMVGSVTDKSARVWMQLNVAKTVTVTTFEIERGGQVSQVSVDVEGPLPFVCDVPINGLSPNRNYRIEIKLDNVRVKLPGGERIITTAPPEGSEANFCIALGSNLRQLEPRDGNPGLGPIFVEIEKLKPRAFLFLGNTASLPLKMEDWPQTNRQAFRVITDAYSKVRREPDLQGLFRTVPCYAVWNDLDFGLPGSDKTWIYKNEAWAAFQRFWPNPDWGTPDNPGTYCNFTIADAEFFLLDPRMYRDKDAMLGEKQLEWLKKSLSQSTATFKLIACGNRLLPACPPSQHRDSWFYFGWEQKEFLRWLFDNNITGVVFLSGGRFGEITALTPPPKNAYRLFELTVGPLAGPTLKAAPENDHRQKAAVLSNSFATLDFGGIRGNRFVTLRLRDDSGTIQMEQTLFAGQLKR